MKKTLLSAVMIASFGIAALASQAARAVDGTITFTGKVVANTCQFSVNNGPASNTVVLPVVFTSSLTAAGNVAGTTPFTISATKCDTNLTSVQAYFTSTANIDGTTGNLKNTGGTAGNVQVQLLNGTTNVPMPLNAASATAQNSPVGSVSSGGTVTMSYKAQYYATGTATPGPVSTSVDYTINYL